jgi:S1-C subfamily serine protease
LDGIQKFGKDYRGFPDLGITVQTLENQNQRAYLGLPADQSGVLVVRVHFNNSCHNVLRPGDVLLKVGEHVIANNGMITFDKHLHGDFTLAVQQFQVRHVPLSPHH